MFYKNSLALHIELADEDNREIGTIYAASGFTQATFQPPEDWPEAKNWALDWALFEVHSDHRRQKQDMAKLLMEWGCVKPRTQYEVTKQGRTTGKTQCFISGFDSILNRAQAGLPNILPAENLEGELFSPSSVHALFPKSQSIFRGALSPGDSGSLILQDQEGLPLGLGFATNMMSGVNYMMPAQLLVRSIEEVTSGKLVGFVNY